MNWTDLLTHPLTGLSLIVGTLGQLSFGLLEPVWALVGATSSYWFPALATTGATILPQFGMQDLGTKILLVAAIAYVTVQADRFADRAVEHLKNR